jgi:hypothetical protein
MQAVLATLERGIAAILDGEEFARYLATLARFHRYSPKNVALIHAQNRDATRVAGYRAWQTLGRQVRKGERGIRIVVPYRARIAQEENDGPGQEIVTGWGVGHVWESGPRPNLLRRNRAGERNPSVKQLAKIAAALNVGIATLFTEESVGK